MLKQTTYYETINPQVLDEAIKASNDPDFGKSMERIAKLSAQIIDNANRLSYFSSNYCACNPQYIIEKKDALTAVLEKRTQYIKRIFFWLNKVCKDTVGSSFLMVKVGNDIEQIANICSDYLDYIGEAYKSQH